jgi:hypothetical protein
MYYGKLEFFTDSLIFAGRQGWLPTPRVVSHKGLHSGWLQPCLRILDLGGNKKFAQQYMCNWVLNEADTIKSSSILFYLKMLHRIYTEKVWLDAELN